MHQAPRYFSELDDGNNSSSSSSNSSSKTSRFLRVAFTSYLSAAAVYFSTIVLGVRLFGARSASFALNSFHPEDPLARLALGAFGTSVLASYPLIFLAMRNWFIGR